MAEKISGTATPPLLRIAFHRYTLRIAFLVVILVAILAGYMYPLTQDGEALFDAYQQQLTKAISSKGFSDSDSGEIPINYLVSLRYSVRPWTASDIVSISNNRYVEEGPRKNDQDSVSSTSYFGKSLSDSHAIETSSSKNASSPTVDLHSKHHDVTINAASGVSTDENLNPRSDAFAKIIRNLQNLLGNDHERRIWTLSAHPLVDRLMLVISLALLAIASFVFLLGNSVDTRKISMPNAEANVNDALLNEMQNVWLNADRFQRGSVYLLFVGVLMAFVGAGVFILTAPDFGAIFAQARPNDRGILEYALAGLRSIGLLVFIEAVAWFLLRQYRASNEDFKAFHRIYLRRSNYFVTFKAYTEAENVERYALLGAALLSEDLTGRLGSGETTEALAAMSLADSNPVFSTLATIFEQAKKAERVEEDNKKSQKGKK